MKKILIIDDDRLLNSLLEKKLTKNGYEVAIATNGDKGLKKIKEIMPNLILLDITMPIMDGYEVMEKISNNDSLKSIPLIVISNSGDPIEIERIKKIGIAKDWIIKVNFNLDEVLSIVQKYI